MPLPNKKNAFLLDSSILNNTNVCFGVIDEYLTHSDIFFNLSTVLMSNNIKLKNYIIVNAKKYENDILKIKLGDNFITIQGNQRSLVEQYHELKKMFDLKVLTISQNIVLECKMNNIECEMYSAELNDKTKFYVDDMNKTPKRNQFKYNSNNNELCRYVDKMWRIIDDKSIYAFTPINYKQKAYMDLLLDDKIKLVLCTGSAGTGKTFLSCLAGIHDMLDNKKYSNIVVSRATIDIGENSIGYLPGTKEEKMDPWIQPIKDNLENIIRKRSGFVDNNENDDNNEDDTISILMMSKKDRKKLQKRNRKNNRYQHINTIKKKENITIDSLIKTDRLKIECISFFRGRTFLNTLCIIDEAQNLTYHEMKTIITRIGEGSKLVMMGDIDQSDLKNKNTDFIDLINKMGGTNIVGAIHLDGTVRSDIASLAVKLL